jgi:hypothetical protein
VRAAPGYGRPARRFSRTERHRFCIERGISGASASTICRRLSEDAIRPWRYRSWIFRATCGGRLVEHEYECLGAVTDLECAAARC